MQAVTYRPSQSDDPGAEPIGITYLDDPEHLIVGVRGDTVSVYGHHAVFRPLTPIAGVTAAKYYPDDGAGTLQAGNGTSLQLAADATTVDITGMLVMMLGGPAAGYWIRAKAYDPNTKVVTPQLIGPSGGPFVSPLTVVPGPGDPYTILYPSLWRSFAHVVGEFDKAAVGGGSVPNVQVLFCLFSYPRKPNAAGGGELGAGGTAEAPHPFHDEVKPLTNLGVQGFTHVPSFYAGQTRSCDARGSVGFKVRLMAVPANGGVVYLAGAST